MKPTIENTARIEIRIILYVFLIYRDVKLPHNGLQIGDVAGLSVQKLVRRTELSVATKLSSGDGTPPIANVMLCGRLSGLSFVSLSVTILKFVYFLFPI